MYSVVTQQGGSRSAASQRSQDRTQEHKESNRKSRRKETLTSRLINYVKQRFNPEKEEEVDAMTVQTGRHRPEELAKLASTTNFSQKEIKLIYRGFKQECPSGVVDEDSFKHIFSQFFPQGDATSYAHHVFNTMKQKQDKTKITFEEFLSILSLVSRGSTQDKLQWVFALYDLDGDGRITKQEMLAVVSSIYAMLGKCTTPSVQDGSAKEHVDRIFHLMDLDQDGCVSLEELVGWCQRDQRVLEGFDTLDTVL